MENPTKYFTKDSSIFTVISIVLLIIGNATFLFWWLVLSIPFLLVKKPYKIGPGKQSWISMSLIIVFGTIILGGVFGLGLMIGFLLSAVLFYLCYFFKIDE